MPRFRLTPIRGASEAVELAGSKVTIGRHPENTVCIEDDRASRNHCVVEPTGAGGVMVKDLGSRNGTMVNEQRIIESPLHPGDVLRIGRHEFLLEAESMDDSSRHIGGALEQMGRTASADRPLDIAWMIELVEIVNGLPPRGAPLEQVRAIDAGGAESAALAGQSDGPNVVRLLLQLASKGRATDIHLEPRPAMHHIRMRIDGEMVPIVDLPTRAGELAYGLIKTLCQMHLAGKDAVQEGHFSVVFPDRRIEYRVSFTPSMHGQKLVVRVLDSRGMPESIADLGMPHYMYERVKKVCEQDQGLLLSCGPTGSGKTTTLYTALKEIDRKSRNVITIEDPVEYTIEGCTQIPVDERQGNTFGSMLRSILRQDPDVILVGEIRDEQTARTAMQAAMTGHVVFSTVHAKDSITSIFRLLDLKVEPFLVANSLDLVLAQRLARVLCTHCRREITVSPAQSTRLGRYLMNKTRIFSATGCVHCLRTGYFGRRAIFELLDVNTELRDVILHEPSISAMRKIIEQGLFTTLAQSGWRLVADGVTTLDEVDRVAGQG